MIEFKMNDTFYRIVPEPYCWAVQKMRVQGPDAKEPGKEVWSGEIYSRDLGHIAKWLINEGVKEGAELFDCVYDMRVAADRVAKQLTKELVALSGYQEASRSRDILVTTRVPGNE